MNVSEALKTIEEAYRAGRSFHMYHTSGPGTWGCTISKKSEWWTVITISHVGFGKSLEEAIIGAATKYRDENV